MLFGRGYALQTVLLWIIFFCSLLNLFLFACWMPTVLNLIGVSPAQAVSMASLRELGAAFAVLYLGLAIDRIGPERARRRRRVHRHDSAFRASQFRSLRRDIPGRDDDHWQPNRRQRGLRETLSSPHAHQRHRVGARHRAAWRNRSTSFGRVFVGDRLATNAHVLGRRLLCADRGGGRVTAGVSQHVCRAGIADTFGPSR
jgi:hypothetical protein